MGEAAISREILHQEGFYPEESSGLFVGISEFEDPRFAPVPFAVDDAVDLAWVLSQELGLLDAHRCVLALAGEPRKAISRSRLESLKSAGAVCEAPRLREVYRLAGNLGQSGTSRGLFILALATHGFSEQGADLLIAADSLQDHPLKTGIEVRHLFEVAASAVAPRRLLLLDACRERLQGETRAILDSPMSQSFASAITQATGLTVLSASTTGGYAYDDWEKQNGVFTSALIDGLRGDAPVDSRGLITVSTLAEYAQERVRAWIRIHRRAHLELSRGIEQRFDELSKDLPLAIPTEDGRSRGHVAAGPVSRYKLRSDRRIHAGAIAAVGVLVLVGYLYSLFGNISSISDEPARSWLPEQPMIPEAGDPYTDLFGQRFRWVPHGTYTVGSSSSDTERDIDETRKKVTLDGFWIAETEVTQSLWRHQGLTNPSSFNDCAECPVERVSWYEALQFANLLSEKAGLSPCYELACTGSIGKEDFACSQAAWAHTYCSGYRLPREAEWEVAARAQAGDEPERIRYGNLEDIAWYKGNSGQRTHPVALKEANAWQLRDLLGNVWEWTWDSEGDNRVVRGGSWDSEPRKLRAACRHGNWPNRRQSYLGFRLAVGQVLSKKRQEEIPRAAGRHWS